LKHGRQSVRVPLKGVNSKRKRLADGTVKTYYWAWKGGPPLPGKPGDPAFVAAYHEAHKRNAPDAGQLSTVISAYRNSDAFLGRAERTRTDYEKYLKVIAKEFGDFPLAGLAEREARAVFLRWRDEVAKRSRRMADYGWSILALVLSWGVENCLVPANPCEKGKRLYKVNRTENIWREEHEAAFLAAASPQMRLAFMLAIWTGQRQGDVLRVTWAAYDGQSIRFTQGKTGIRVIVKVGAPLKAILDVTPRRAPQIVTNDEGRPFTSSGFRASFRKTQARAGITGLTFHDLRGTAVTRLAVAGATEMEIAAITGHAVSTCARSWTGIILAASPSLAKAPSRSWSGRRRNEQWENKDSRLTPD
jgi:integrase